MTFLIYALATLSAICLVGAAPLYFSFKHAAVGYEDENGFNYGEVPAPAITSVAAAPARTEELVRS
jgi:hypothetical protein